VLLKHLVAHNTLSEVLARSPAVLLFRGGSGRNEHSSVDDTTIHSSDDGSWPIDRRFAPHNRDHPHCDGSWASGAKGGFSELDPHTTHVLWVSVTKSLN